MSDDQHKKRTKKGTGNMPVPGPGRPPGCLNRTTRLKNAILDGIALAAKRKKQKPAEYMADILETPDKLGIINAGVRLIPKEIKTELTERVCINLSGDEDCDSDSDD